MASADDFSKADTHTHTWIQCFDATASGGAVDTSSCAPAPRRYTPEGVLPADKLLAEFDENDMDYGVLVQVSFMGTDNSYVVDHFSRPNKELNLDDPGWLAVLEAGETGRVWMKVSASYRLGVSEDIMMEYAQQAKAHFGINRLL